MKYNSLLPDIITLAISTHRDPFGFYILNIQRLTSFRYISKFFRIILFRDYNSQIVTTRSPGRLVILNVDEWEIDVIFF